MVPFSSTVWLTCFLYLALTASAERVCSSASGRRCAVRLSRRLSAQSEPKLQVSSRNIEQSMTKTANSTFQVFIEGAPSSDHVAAIQYATQVIANSWISSQPVRVKVNFRKDLGDENTLGDARSTSAWFLGGFAYPVSMAKALLKMDLNAEDAGEDFYDVIVRLNTKTNWYTKIDGETTWAKFDLVTVCMHELLHGLIITGGGIEVKPDASVSSGFSAHFLGNEYVWRFEAFIAVGTDKGVDCPVATYRGQTDMLGSALTSNNLWFVTSSGRRVASLNAPVIYEPGSSTYHLASAHYPNDLMSPSIPTQYSSHTISPLIREIFRLLMNDKESGANICERPYRPARLSDIDVLKQNLGTATQSLAPTKTPPTFLQSSLPRAQPTSLISSGQPRAPSPSFSGPEMKENVAVQSPDPSPEGATSSVVPSPTAKPQESIGSRGFGFSPPSSSATPMPEMGRPESSLSSSARPILSPSAFSAPSKPRASAVGLAHTSPIVTPASNRSPMMSPSRSLNPGELASDISGSAPGPVVDVRPSTIYSPTVSPQQSAAFLTVVPPTRTALPSTGLSPPIAPGQTLPGATGQYRLQPTPSWAQSGAPKSLPEQKESPSSTYHVPVAAQSVSVSPSSTSGQTPGIASSASNAPSASNVVTSPTMERSRSPSRYYLPGPEKNQNHTLARSGSPGPDVPSESDPLPSQPPIVSTSEKSVLPTDSSNRPGPPKRNGPSRPSNESPSASQSPTPRAQADQSGACFPSEALAEVEGIGNVALRYLTIGQRVRTGPRSFSSVYAFSHRDSEAVSDFVSLKTATGEEVELSPGHFIFTNNTARLAREVRVGDVLLLASGQWVTVAGKRRIRRRGLFNPHTMDGRIVINRIVVTTSTESVPAAAASALLIPLRTAHRIAYIYSRLGSF